MSTITNTPAEIIEDMEYILEGITAGQVFTTDGRGNSEPVDFPGPADVEVELYPAEGLDLDKVREALAEIFYPMPQPWRLLDNGEPGIFGGPSAVHELVDILSSRRGRWVLATLSTRQVCHKCAGEDCHLSGEAERAGVLLLEAVIA